MQKVGLTAQSKLELDGQVLVEVKVALVHPQKVAPSPGTRGLAAFPPSYVEVHDSFQYAPYILENARTSGSFRSNLSKAVPWRGAVGVQIQSPE